MKYPIRSTKNQIVKEDSSSHRVSIKSKLWSSDRRWGQEFHTSWYATRLKGYSIANGEKTVRVVVYICKYVCEGLAGESAEEGSWKNSKYILIGN